MRNFFALITTLFMSAFSFNISKDDKDLITKTAFDSFDDDSFDDDDNFDATGDFYARGAKRGGALQRRPAPRPAAKGTQGTFTIQVENLHAAACNIELFNSLRSIADTINADLLGGYKPFNAIQRDIANLNSMIYWSDNGSLIIQNAAGLKVTISCKQIPYRTLLESVKSWRLHISAVRMTFTNDTQLDNDITVRYNNILGKFTTNPITPRTYFKDGQFQSKQVTLNQKFAIDGEKGLTYTINSGETNSFTFIVSAIEKI